MRFGRGACSARPVTSIGGPLDRFVINLIQSDTIWKFINLLRKCGDDNQEFILALESANWLCWSTPANARESSLSSKQELQSLTTGTAEAYNLDDRKEHDVSKCSELFSTACSLHSRTITQWPCPIDLELFAITLIIYSFQYL